MPSKEMMHLILDKTVQEINAAKACDGVSKEKESEIIEKHKKTMPWIDRNWINYFQHKRTKGNDTNFIMPPMGISFVPPELQQPATILEEHPLPDIAPAADEEQQDDLQDVLIKKKMKGGHPKGSTDARYEELKRKFILATNYASIKFSEVKTLSGSADLKRGVLDSIIEEAKTKFNLPANYMINKETVRTRVKRGNLTANHKGTPSPMEKVEMHALDIICQMAELRQPLTP